MLIRIIWLATVALIALGASACTAGVGAEQVRDPPVPSGTSGASDPPSRLAT